MIKIFDSVLNLYEISKNPKKFYDKIINSNNFISKELFNDLINQNIKVQAKKLLFKINKLGYKPININSKNYPKTLLNLYNPPLVIYVKDNKLEKYNLQTIFNKPSIHILLNNNNGYINNIYFKKTLNLVISSINETNSNLVFAFKNNIITIKSQNINLLNQICVESYNINELDNIKNENTTDLKIILIHNFKENKESMNSFITENVICGMSDILIVMQAEFSKNTVKKVDNFLEQGKDIFAIPGNIFDVSNNFSNYIIKEGAIPLISKQQFIEYIRDKNKR